MCFRLGWHVLRNRDYESRDRSKEARDLTEKQLFAQDVWRNLPRGIVGIHTPGEILSRVLLEQIKTELPSLIKDISSSLEECQARLSRIGESHVTINQQRLFLLRVRTFSRFREQQSTVSTVTRSLKMLAPKVATQNAFTQWFGTSIKILRGG